MIRTQGTKKAIMATYKRVSVLLGIMLGVRLLLHRKNYFVPHNRSNSISTNECVGSQRNNFEVNYSARQFPFNSW